ncbi:MAG: protein phosphatase 2C domain-containing protein [Pirellula sp.]
MLEAKNTQRAIVRIGYDGRVHKQFLGPNAKERFDNECRVLNYLEMRRCPFVPRLLASDPQTLEIVTSNCGARVEHLGDERIQELFGELEKFGVRHDDAFLRNITYRSSDGRFCIIDFEFSTILDDAAGVETSQPPQEAALVSAADRALEVSWSAMSHPGSFRANNEDRFLAILSDGKGVRYLGKTGAADTANGDLVFAVADGMGGERSGELAGKIAVDRITQMLPAACWTHDAQLLEQSEELLRALFRSIHQELDRVGVDMWCRNMGSTLTLVWIHRSLVMYAHVGDTRLYHVTRAGEAATGAGNAASMRQISEDHTFVGWLRRNGQINERQARFHPRKNVLSRALGASHQFVEPQIGALELKHGDKLLLCSDGVIEGLWDHALLDLMVSPDSVQASQTAAQRIVLSAVSESGRDNATAIVIEVGDVSGRP